MIREATNLDFLKEMKEDFDNQNWKDLGSKIDYFTEHEMEEEQRQKVGQHETIVSCDDWIHQERVKNNDDRFCPMCGERLQDN